jgi:hypothetical protein
MLWTATKPEMSKSKPITEEESTAIKQSLQNAWLKVLLEHRARFRRIAKYSIKAGALETIVVKPDEKTLPSLYRFADWREAFPLDSAVVRRIILKALRKADSAFFIRLGRVLSAKPCSMRWWLISAPLKSFLLLHWAESRDGLPELFRLTPDALTRVCRDKLGLNGLSTDVVIKTRQSLRLMPFKRQKQDAVRIGGRWTFPEVEKRTFR